MNLGVIPEALSMEPSETRNPMNHMFRSDEILSRNRSSDCPVIAPPRSHDRFPVPRFLPTAPYSDPDIPFEGESRARFRRDQVDNRDRLLGLVEPRAT